jgi:sugar lactone lactonase YvrE
MKKTLCILSLVGCFYVKAQIISTVAGSGPTGYFGDGGAATAAVIDDAIGVNFDAAGNMYIADTYNHRVRMVNTSGIISTVVGTGTSGYSGDGGQATAAQISNVSGLSFDAAGNMYIADAGNNCIRKVNTAGVISTFAGNGYKRF